MENNVDKLDGFPNYYELSKKDIDKLYEQYQKIKELLKNFNDLSIFSCVTLDHTSDLYEFNANFYDIAMDRDADKFFYDTYQNILDELNKEHQTLRKMMNIAIGTSHITKNDTNIYDFTDYIFSKNLKSEYIGEKLSLKEKLHNTLQRFNKRRIN